MTAGVKGYPYAFHVALDGNGINGLEGLAGVCLFLYDPADEAYAYKIRYFDGIAAGHAVSVNPSGTRRLPRQRRPAPAVLRRRDARGDRARLDTAIRGRPASLQGSTHLVWLAEREFITAIGEHFYRFSLNDLGNPARTRAARRQTAARHEAHRRRAATSATARWTTRPRREAARPPRRHLGHGRRRGRPSSSCRPPAGTSPCHTTRRSVLRRLLPGPAAGHVDYPSGRWPTSRSTPSRSTRRAARWCDTGPPGARCRRTSTPTWRSPTGS